MRYLIPLMLLATPALAQENMERCADTDKIVKFLAESYGERPFVEMDNKYEKHLVLFWNGDTGTWTVVAVDKDKACGVDAGKNMKPADKTKLSGSPS